MKKTILILFISFSNILAAQNSLAKIEYSYAEEAFNKKEFSKVLKHLEEVKSLLGSTNARILYLEILSRSNNLPNYQAFNNSFTFNKANNSIDNSINEKIKKQITPQMLSIVNSNKKLTIEMYSKSLNQAQTKESQKFFNHLINKLKNGQNVTYDDFLQSTYNNVNNSTNLSSTLNKENTNSEIINWIESVELINSLCDIYLENFENDVPLEKLKKVYEIKKQCKIFIPNKQLIKQSWGTLKKEEYENALIKFKELQIAGIESSSLISEIQKIIQLEQLEDKARSSIEKNIVFVKGDTNTNIPNLYVSKYELTKKEYIDIMSPENSNYTKCGDCPISLSRGKAKIFITTLNKKTGKNYRLPTKEEWYWFATGGINSSDIKRGKNKEKSKNVLDYAWCSGNSDGARKKVGSLEPNELGLFDVWGNVSEMTTTNAVGGAYLTKKSKIIKGDTYVHSYMWDNEEDEWSTMGIRLVISDN